MDNLSHSLTGLVLAQAGLRRVVPHATAVLLISANAPDLDVVTATRGSLAYLEAHRGYTHCLVCLPFVALLSTLLAAAILRRKLSWIRAWSVACIGVASHLLLDWTNSYGIRLLLPFSSTWFHLDWNGLYDGIFLGLLGMAVVWPLLANLVSREIGDRSSHGFGVAIAALLAILLLEGGRAWTHARAVGQLQSRLYEEQQALQAAALPDAFNPLRWRGIVETENAYFVVPTDFAGQPELHELQAFYKPPGEPIVGKLKKLESFGFFSYFARFPAWAIVPFRGNDGAGTRIDLTDLRFGVPGSGSFHCLATLDAKEDIT